MSPLLQRRALNMAGRRRPYVFSVWSAAVFGRSNVRPPNALELIGISPAPESAAPEDGRTPLNRYRRPGGLTTALVGLLGAGMVLVPGLAPSAELLPPGHRPLPPGVHALVGGKVVVRPGNVIDAATIVIRDGLIQSVGPNVNPPPDARVWDMKGTTIYAGLIDPYLTLAATNPPVSTRGSEPITLTSGGPNFFGVPGQEIDPGNPGPGYGLANITPERRVARAFAPEAKALETLRELGFTAGNVVPSTGIVRGTSSFVVLSDANPNETILKPDVFQHVAFDTTSGKEGAYPASLMGVIAAVRQIFFDAQHYALEQADGRAQGAARKRTTFNPALDSLSPALEKKMPVMLEPGSALMVDRAARLARELNLNFYLLASGQEWRRPELAKAAGVPLIVPLNFPELPRMPEEDDWTAVSLDQFRAWDWASENPAVLRSQGVELALTTYGLSERKNFRKNLRLALDRGLAENDALAALTLIPARLCGLENQLGSVEAGKIANLTIVAGDSYFNPEAKVREVWIDGRIFRVEPSEVKVADKSKTAPGEVEKDAKAKDDKAKKQAELKEMQRKRVARSPQTGRGVIAEPPAVLVQGATVWTSGMGGRMEGADLLIVGDKIKAIGRELQLPGEFAGQGIVIDGRGKHITPGLIDAHSHSMILGAVNEATLPSTAMVRVGDVVNSETDNLHQQLAGGLTTANLLHGSANPIGGQNCVIKLRDGSVPEDLKFVGAPSGIKFALGENVKQSNWGEKNVTRFPQSRMGVKTFLANRFTAARQYLKEWEDYKKGGSSTSPPPRRDLDLETLGEILQHQRWIHCHSYRQDEILMLLRLMEDFGVQVGTLQHVLEGYKVADEIARHGAGASCFSDWWGYKYEVIDAIPYAGSLMHDRGVLVTFNSDSSDLARRLYLEAAKAVKYGGTTEEEALKFVTFNAAKQLRIDQRVGSLEPGKDADFVLWSRSPLDSGAVCLQTWIDGKKYFDRERETERTAELEKERAALLEKAKKILGTGEPAGGAEGEKQKFFQRALEHLYDGQDRHCLDEE